MKIESLLLVVWLLSSGLSSCAYMKALLGFGYVQPKTELKSIELVGISYGSLDVIVTLSVENPNDFEIKLEKMDYQINVANLKVASGMLSEKFSVKASGRGELRLPLKLEAENALKVITIVFSDRTAEHQASVEGTAYFKTYFGIMEHAFKGNKKLKF